MRTVTLEQLDASTSEWLRKASAHDGVLVTEQGRPLLTISPIHRVVEPSSRFRDRPLLPEFVAYMDQPVAGTDSAEMISQEREARL